MQIRPFRFAINEDTDSELRYWINSLLAALGAGAAFAVAAGLLIAGLADAGFARDFWPWLVECAFWLGMLLGMLWAAGKRIGSALAGALPWREAQDPAEATGRFFGQTGAFSALVGFSLWLTHSVALAAQLDGLAALSRELAPLSAACWLAAALFAAIACGCRQRRRQRSSQPRR